MEPIAWLLRSDPAIRWQAMRDLTDASSAAVAAERTRVPHEGIAAAILARQQPDGSWRSPDKPVWLATLFTMLLLRATGIDRTEPAVAMAVTRLETSLQWNDQPECWDLRPPAPGGHPFFTGEVESCINGGVLRLGAYFGRPTESLARRLLEEQLSDGGWNCEAPASTRSSFHTTICVLEGLLEYEQAVGFAPEITQARQRGEEYLLQRALFRRRSTGEVVDPAFLTFAFPPRYHYDILRALDYLRQAGVAPESRIDEALHIIATRQQADGQWLLDNAYEDAGSISTGESVGQPSRWNTLRALRVQRWSVGKRLTTAAPPAQASPA